MTLKLCAVLLMFPILIFPPASTVPNNLHFLSSSSSSESGNPLWPAANHPDANPENGTSLGHHHPHSMSSFPAPFGQVLAFQGVLQHLCSFYEKDKDRREQLFKGNAGMKKLKMKHIIVPTCLSIHGVFYYLIFFFVL